MLHGLGPTIKAQYLRVRRSKAERPARPPQVPCGACSSMRRPQCNAATLTRRSQLGVNSVAG